MSLTLEPVRVATNGHDEEGRLVFAHRRLVQAGSIRALAKTCVSPSTP